MNRRISAFIVKHRTIILIAIFLISILSLFGIRKIHFSNKMTSWLSEKDLRLSLFLKTSDEFAINNLVFVMIKPKNGDVFTKAFLEKVKEFTEQIKEKKEIFIVTSITNTSDIRKSKDGIEVRDLIENIPENNSELRKLKNYILSKENYVGNIVSKDGKWAGVSIFIKEKYDPIKVTGNIIIPTAKKTFSEKADLFFSGIPSDSYFANEYTIKDLKLLTPLIILLIIFVLFFSFKNFQGILLPSLVVIISNLWLFGILGFLNKPLTMISPAIPVLLVALGSAYGIHIINKYFLYSDLKDENSLVNATSEIFTPVLLAGLTTFVGFVSFISARLKLIADFGFFSGVGIFIALLISLSLIPAAYSTRKGKRAKIRKEDKHWKILDILSDFVIKNRKTVFISSIIILIIFSLGILKVKREVNFSEYYPKNSQPRLGQEIVKREFSGAYPVLFYLKSDNVKSPQTLRLLRKAENYLFSKKDLATPFSISEIVQELNSKLNDRFSIPDNKISVGNLWFFMEGRDELKQLLSGDNKKTIIFSKTSESSTSYNKKLYSDLENFIKKSFRKKYYSYRLKRLNLKDKKKIRLMEAAPLSKEIYWLSLHYGKAIDSNTKAKILRILSSAVENDNKLSDSKIKKIINNYVCGDEFDFDIDGENCKKLSETLYSLYKQKNLKGEPAIRAMKTFVTKEEFDIETAKNSLETILFKINDQWMKDETDKIVKRIVSLINVRNKDFEKRVKSIIFDVFDSLAIIPEKRVGNIKGAPVNFKIFQTGNPSLITALDESLFSSQVQSLILAYFITLFLMILLRKSIPIGIVSTLPILFTVSLMYGFLGFINLPLDYATMMIGGISIGVGIDYAIHFIHGIMEELEKESDIDLAVKKTFIDKGRAILTNSFAVMLGFAVLIFSSMLPLRNFGSTMVASMFLSAFATLTLLPSAILILKLKIKKEV